MRLFLTLAGVISALSLYGAAHAEYPERPIRLIVVIAPGGGPDITARVLAPILAERLGKPVVVENKPGSNGNIAGEYVARSAPDGYTLLYGHDSLFAISPHVYARMGFDPLKDLVPVATTTTAQLIFSAHPSVPVKDFQEFLSYARQANPPPNYASAGNGTQHHLAVEMLKQRAGINLVHIPYKSGSPAAQAAIAGEVPFVMSGSSSGPFVKAGKLRALAVTGRKRMPLFPDVPTIGEFFPGCEITLWLGIWAPAGTAQPVIARLREEINYALALPDVKQRFQSVGDNEPWITTPAEFEAVIRRDYEKYGKLVKQIGVRID